MSNILSGIGLAEINNTHAVCGFGEVRVQLLRQQSMTMANSPLQASLQIQDKTPISAIFFNQFGY